MKDRSRPRPIGEVIEDLLASLGQDRVYQEQRVFEVWARAVGGTLARHCRPAAVSDGRLVVMVRDSAWLQELQFMKDEIVRKLNRELGSRVILDLRFKIGAWEDDPQPESEAGQGERELDPAVVEEAKAAVAAIPDPRLRDQVLRALLAAAKRELTESPDD